VRQATALLLLWPIGFPTLFTLLLLRCRGDILNGRSTPLSRATTFLHQDYKPKFFFWEPVEMARRLSITGFVLLVEDAQHRLYLAVMLSAGFSIMLAYVRPYAKPINNLLALGAHLSITSTLVAGTFLRLFAGVEKGLDGDRQQPPRASSTPLSASTSASSRSSSSPRSTRPPTALAPLRRTMSGAAKKLDDAASQTSIARSWRKRMFPRLSERLSWISPAPAFLG